MQGGEYQAAGVDGAAGGGGEYITVQRSMQSATDRRLVKTALSPPFSCPPGLPACRIGLALFPLHHHHHYVVTATQQIGPDSIG